MIPHRELELSQTADLAVSKFRFWYGTQYICIALFLRVRYKKVKTAECRILKRQLFHCYIDALLV
jgi:hypothetical protein